MILYGFASSSASFRVRIALAVKNMRATQVSVKLSEGEHRRADYLRLNPQGFVPALRLDDGRMLTQSGAIIEYLEETIPAPRLLPADPAERAEVRALCQLIACDVHPLNNLRVRKYLEGTLRLDQNARDTWYRHWVQQGFDALEQFLARTAGRFSVGDAPSMADVYLVPQVFNARRFATDLAPYPRIVAIDAACRELPAFAGAAPDKQPG